MKAYRTNTVVDADRIVLKGVPFQPGQRVEVLVIPQSEARSTAVEEFKALLATTQSLPQIRQLTDEEIEAEVAAHRASE